MALQIFGGGSAAGGGGGGGGLSLDTDGVPYFTVSGGDTTAPTVPGTPVATGGNASASVAFTGSTDAVGVVGYRVYASTDSYTAVAASSTSSPITVTGLTNGTPVTFKASAYDAAGNESAKSAASNSVTPAAPATTLLSDNFNRADAGSVGAPQIGSTPTEVNTWIRSNTCHFATGGASIAWPIAATDYTAQLTCAAGSADVSWRRTDDNNRYTWAGSSSGDIQRRVGGVFTIIGNAGNFGVGDVIKVKTQGSTHTIYKNGTQVGTVTDSSITAAGTFMVASGAGSRIDDLTVTTP